MVTLCADDYGLYAEIDDAVLILAEKQILHATSCMTTSPRWHLAASRLRPWIGKIDIGLHLNLTEGFGQHAPSLPAIIVRSYAHLLNRQALKKAFRIQFDAFSQALGDLPTMIDGHQHIHQLPLIRDVLLETIDDLYKEKKKVWVRNTVPISFSWKQAWCLWSKPNILRWLGGGQLARQLEYHGLASNKGFAGVYDFAIEHADQYGAYMAVWLAQAFACNRAERLLLMCHPATAVVTGDAIAVAREKEFTYLMSSAFQALCRQGGMQLGRMPCVQPLV